jgi:hypothetical protein
MLPDPMLVAPFEGEPVRYHDRCDEISGHVSRLVDLASIGQDGDLVKAPCDT